MERIKDNLDRAIEELGWIYNELPYEGDGQCYCNTVIGLLRECLEILDEMDDDDDKIVVETDQQPRNKWHKLKGRGGHHRLMVGWTYLVLTESHLVALAEYRGHDNFKFRGGKEIYGVTHYALLPPKKSAL